MISNIISPEMYGSIDGGFIGVNGTWLAYCTIMVIILVSTYNIRLGIILFIEGTYFVRYQGLATLFEDDSGTVTVIWIGG